MMGIRELMGMAILILDLHLHHPRRLHHLLNILKRSVISYSFSMSGQERTTMSGAQSQNNAGTAEPYEFSPAEPVD